MKTQSINSKIIIKSNSIQNTIITGYASVFGVADSDNDIIVKGAFANTSASKVKLLWQHDMSKPIGVITNLYEDKHGLKIEAEINNKTTAGFEASELIKQKAIQSLSIGFFSKISNYTEKGHRLITDVDLIEVSVVTFPANHLAEIYQYKNNNLNYTASYLKLLDKIEYLLYTLKTFI